MNYWIYVCDLEGLLKIDIFVMNWPDEECQNIFMRHCIYTSRHSSLNMGTYNSTQ